MERTNITTARKNLSQIITKQKVIEVDNQKSSSVILPTSLYKSMERHIVELELTLSLERNAKMISLSDVENEVLKVVNESKR